MNNCDCPVDVIAKMKKLDLVTGSKDSMNDDEYAQIFSRQLGGSNDVRNFFPCNSKLHRGAISQAINSIAVKLLSGQYKYVDVYVALYYEDVVGEVSTSKDDKQSGR